MTKAKDGDWYVYTGEDGDAIAVAMNGRGPNGGWCGIGLARMELPSKDKTREEINAAAKIMAAGKDLLAVLQDVVNSDMAMREEDDGRGSVLLDRARAAILKATSSSEAATT